MTYKHIFVDSDVLLDILLERKPHCDFGQRLFNKGKNKEIVLATSALVIANIYCIMAKTIGKAEAKKNTAKLLNVLKVFPLDAECIKSALGSDFNDIEDGMQYSIATQNKCELIITRNIKDYKASLIPILSAEHYLDLI